MSDFKPVKVTFDQGEVTARPKEYLKPGELVQSVGAEYRLRGDNVRLHRIPGRTLFGTIGGGVDTVDGIKICRFDIEGEDKVLAMTRNGLFVSDIDVGTFSQIDASRVDSQNDRMSAAHVNDSWFISIRSSLRTSRQNTVLLPDGSTRSHGMIPPAESLVLNETAGLDPGQEILVITVDDAETTSPDPLTWGSSPVRDVVPFQNTANVESLVPNLANEPYSHARMGIALPDDPGVHCGASWGFSNTDNGIGRSQRHLEIRYFITNWRFLGQPFNRAENVDSFNVAYRLEISEDAGATYEIATGPHIYGKFPGFFNIPAFTVWQNHIDTFVVPVFVNADSITNDQLRFRMFAQLNGPYNDQGILYDSSVDVRIYSVRILGEDQAVSTDPDKRLEYAFTEVAKDIGLESEPSSSVRAVLEGANGVIVDFPDPVNEATTHYRLYRTPEFAVTDPKLVPTTNEVLSRLGFVMDVPITDVNGNDLRSVRDPLEFFNQQTYPPIDLISISLGDGSVAYFPENTPPPRLTHLSAFKNSLVGVSGRSWFRSLPAQPDKWPLVLAIDSLPLEENDELVACLQVNDSLIIAADGVILAIDEMPRIQNRIFVPPNPRKVAEVGLVSQDAITTVSQGGDREDLCAWVSRHGIHLTNTRTSRTITDDSDWSSMVDVDSLSTAVLDFDVETLQLKFCYDSDGDGTNDRFALIHMAPSHRKENGLPRITWGHYGNLQALDSQLLGNGLKSFSGGPDGQVFTERDGESDDSNAYDGNGTIPFRVGLHLNGDWHYLQAYRGSLRSDSSGSLQMTIRIVANSETYDEIQNVTEQVTINGRPVNFLIDRAGESFDLTFEVDDLGDFSLMDCRILVSQGDLV
jgi:hypothetical protein